MMNNPIHFTDERFDPQNSGNCHLFIHLDANSCAYAIVDKNTDRLDVLFKKHFTLGINDFSALNRLENLKTDHQNLNLPFRKVKISVETKAFTFVPEPLFSSDDLPNYSKFMGAVPESTLLNSDISALGIKNIFAIEPDLASMLHNTFADPLIVSKANPLISGIYRLLEKGNYGELFLNFNHNSFEAVVIQNNALVFYNSFDISDADEFNYFVLNLISQLNLSRSQAVTLSGEISRNNDLYVRLQKYFDYISFAEAELISSMPENQLVPHQFFSLLSLDLCE